MTPRFGHGWEALLRYDHLTPDLAFDRQIRSRTIAGVAYWFPQQRSVSTALLLDYDGTLVPFALSPDLARPDGALIELLGKLAARPGWATSPTTWSITAAA